MKSGALLFLLLLAPSLSLPGQVSYDLSCENVDRIRIVRVEDSYFDIKGPAGHFYIAGFIIKSEQINSWMQFRDSAPTTIYVHKGINFTEEDILLTANGTPLHDNAKSPAGLTNDSVNIAIIKEKDAFEAARMVCPALVPDKVLIDGQIEESSSSQHP